MKNIIASCVLAFAWALSLTGCSSHEPEYSQKISQCIKETREVVRQRGGILYFENPLRICLDKSLQQQVLPAMSFVDSEGSQIALQNPERPLVIQILSNEYSHSIFERQHLNAMVAQYSGKIDFIFLTNRQREISPMCSSKLYRAKFEKECTPFQYAKQAKLVYFNKDEVDTADDDLGYIINGLRATEFPTTYYINKDRTIFKLEVLEDIMVRSNIIYRNSPGKSDEEIARLSFEERVPEILAALVKHNN